MQFGCSTMFLRERTVAVALDAIAGAGFAAAEIWVEHLVSSGERAPAIRRQAQQLGLVITLHAPSYDVNVSSINPGIRKESIRQMQRSLKLAAALGATVVVMHPGSLSHGRDSLERVWTPFVDTVAQLDEQAAALGVRLGVEGMERRKGEYLVEPADLARLFATPRQATGMTIDLAHAATVMPPLDYIASVSRLPIVHAHCSDHSNERTHLPLGHGTLDVPALIRALGRRYDGIVSLEGYVPGKGDEVIAGNARYLQQHGFM